MSFSSSGITGSIVHLAHRGQGLQLAAEGGQAPVPRLVQVVQGVAEATGAQAGVVVQILCATIVKIRHRVKFRFLII